MLVPNFADQLLDDVLDGDDPLRSAELVHDNGDMHLFLLQLLQKLGDLDRRRNEQRRLQDAFNGVFRAAQIAVEVLFVHDADNVIDCFTIDGNARKAGLFKQLLQRGGRFLDVDCDHVDARGENVARIKVGELDNVVEKLLFAAVDAAVLLRLVHQRQKLVLGDAAAFLHADETGNGAFQMDEQKAQREKQGVEHRDRTGHFERKAVGSFLCQAFRRDLAEDQHHHRHDDGGNGGAVVFEKADKQHRRDAGGGNVHDVVADEHGGKQTVIAVEQLHDAPRAAVAVGCHVFDAHAVQRHICRLGRRKKGGQGDKNDEG